MSYVYAKINQLNEVEKYPYTFDDLKDENPSTSYDGRLSLFDWFHLTEEGTSGKRLVEVITTNEISEEYDMRTHKIIMSNSPVCDDGVWKLKYIPTAKTEEEIKDFDIMLIEAAEKAAAKAIRLQQAQQT